VQNTMPAMSKYQLKCSCLNCRKETTVQSLKEHYLKCTRPVVFANRCKECNAETNNLEFCSHSCRATHLNQQRERKVKLVPVDTRHLAFIEGRLTERSSLRKHLARTVGYKCSRCSTSTWNDEPITLVVDHIDGNAGNNMPDNLRLLCPNCNSQTPTFGGRNKGHGRKARGLKLC